MDLVTYGKATRQIVFDKSICSSTPTYNHHIRRALGFREIGTSAKGRPKFISENVSSLYAELNVLANGFQNHSPDEIKKTWQRRTYVEDIQRLLAKYGKKIWGESRRTRTFEPGLPAVDGSRGKRSGRSLLRV